MKGQNLVFIILMFATAIRMASAQAIDNNLVDICVQKSPNAETAGFVCLSSNSPRFLRCHLAEQVSGLEPCPAGTKCIAPVGVFTIENPCGEFKSFF